MDIIVVLGPVIMAVATFVMVFATFLMVKRVKKASEDDTKAHKEDRELDAKMHSFEHVISLAHLEAEQLKGLKPDTAQALAKIKKEILKRI